MCTPVQCDLCEKTFKCKENLSHHINSEHPRNATSEESSWLGHMNFNSYSLAQSHSNAKFLLEHVKVLGGDELLGEIV